MSLCILYLFSELVINTDDGDNEEGAFNNYPPKLAPGTLSDNRHKLYAENALLHELESVYNQLSETNELNISVTRAWTVRIFRRLRHFIDDGFLTPYFA